MNTYANLSRATSNSNGRTQLARSLRAAGVLLSALALADAASAQTTHREWHGGIFHASQGSWSMETSPGQGLNLVPQDPTVPGRVDILLPPVGSTGVGESVQLDLAQLDPTGTLIQPGAELKFTSHGTVGGVADQPIGSLHLVKQPGGSVQYQWDFGAIGATSYTLEFYDGPILVGQVTGVPGGLGGGPLCLPNCDAHPWCCWTMQVVYLGGHWYNTWACVIPMNWQGQMYNMNRMVVTPENPTLPVGELTGCSLESRGIPVLPLTDMVLSGYAPIGSNYCSANPNSTGLPGTISALGSGLVAANDLDLYAFQLPQNAFGYFIVSPFQAFVPNAGGAQGNLCVGLNTGRFRSQLGNTGTDGYLVVHVDLNDMPQPNGSVVVQAGQTWNFQCWHRDANPNVTSNFTTGYSITFQ